MNEFLFEAVTDKMVVSGVKRGTWTKIKWKRKEK